jgi:hypothetical protein
MGDFGVFVGKKGKGYSFGKVGEFSGQDSQQAVDTLEPGSFAAGKIGGRRAGRCRGKKDL